MAACIRRSAHIGTLVPSRTLRYSFRLTSNNHPTYAPPSICTGRNSIRPISPFSNSAVVLPAKSHDIRHERTHDFLNHLSPVSPPQARSLIRPCCSFLCSPTVSPTQGFLEDLAPGLPVQFRCIIFPIRDLLWLPLVIALQPRLLPFNTRISFSMASASPLSPTFYGYIASTQDALLLFETCLSGALNHVARRPHDRERVSLIKSGNVFIYEEHSSGIKRWTDGVPWSPSRILSNFLVYRELERPFPPREKKRAMKRSKNSPGVNKQDSFGGANSSMSGGYNSASAFASSFDATPPASLSKEAERSLIGSLVDSYGFKEEGLVKKTLSVTVGGISHHLVSYYTVIDVMNNKFTTPSKDPRFQHVTPRGDLITKQNFRTPIDEVDSMDRIDDRSVYTTYPYARNGSEMTNQTISHRPMSFPTPTIGYGSGSSMFGNYSMKSYAASYESLGQGPASVPYGGQYAPPPGIYPGTRTENYDLGGYRQQRYNSVTGVGSDTGRSQMPSVTTNFIRRPSNFEQAISMDSGISRVSSLSSDLKLTNDSGYSSQAFYVDLRDTSNNSHNYTHHRALPSPAHQSIYDRVPVSSYSALDRSNIKENMRQFGNTSTGHGHDLAS